MVRTKLKGKASEASTARTDAPTAPTAAGTAIRPSASASSWPRVSPRALSDSRWPSASRARRLAICPTTTSPATATIPATTHNALACVATARRTSTSTHSAGSRVRLAPSSSVSSCSRRSATSAPSTSDTSDSVADTPIDPSSSSDSGKTTDTYSSWRLRRRRLHDAHEGGVEARSVGHLHVEAGLGRRGLADGDEGELVTDVRPREGHEVLGGGELMRGVGRGKPTMGHLGPERVRFPGKGDHGVDGFAVVAQEAGEHERGRHHVVDCREALDGFGERAAIGLLHHRVVAIAPRLGVTVRRRGGA